jgi:putative ABC transport system permease protein
MLRQTVKGLLARKLRVLLTGVAVMLGVGLVSGTLVLTDTTKAVLEKSFARVTEDIDVQVRPNAAALPGGGKGGTGIAGVPASLLDRIAGVSGVEQAGGSVTGYAQLLGRDGRPAGPGEPLGRSIGPSFAPDLTAGHAPAGPSEVVIDQASADREDVGIGDRVQVVTASSGPQTFTVAGILDAPQFKGATLAGFDLPTAQRLLNRQSQLDTIDVQAAGGVDQVTLRDRVAAVIDPGLEAVTGGALAGEQAADLEEELDLVSDLVLVFGLVALLIGAFIIHNTFSILVAQRTRELALLRCLGASRRQVRNSVLVESVLVGIVAATAGLLLGVAVVVGLRALLASTPGLRALAGLPQHVPVLAPRTVVVALVAGTVVTALSALAPAQRATRVPPVAALREELATPDRYQTRQADAWTVVGMLLGLAGVGVVLAGVLGGGAGYYVGGGAVLLLIGLRLAGPLLARQLARAVGLPIARALRLPGRLARENAMRNPRRTAATALALTIGVGLLSVITILAASTKAAAVAEFDRADRSNPADFELRVGDDDGLPPPIDPEVAMRLRALPELAVVADVQYLPQATVGGDPGVVGADPVSYQQVAAINVTQGSLADLGADGIAVARRQADTYGWRIGAPVPVALSGTTTTHTFTVKAIHDTGRSLLALLAPAGYQRLGHDQSSGTVLARTAAGVAPATARAAIDRALAGFPTVQVEDRADRRRQAISQIDPALRLYLALIGLAIVIGLFGIVNTLALSVFERVRELGLLRAVGMDRRQVRSMVRWEAVIITAVGAVVGIGTGSFLGWAATRALEDSSSPTRFTLPTAWLALFALLAVLAGVLAAVLPARRASRVDVLRAVAAE